MPRNTRNRPHKTSGEAYEVFRKIGKVGGNTVGALVVGGKIFNAIVELKLLTKDQIRKAAEAADVALEDVDDAMALAEEARKELGMVEKEMKKQ